MKLSFDTVWYGGNDYYKVFAINFGEYYGLELFRIKVSKR